VPFKTLSTKIPASTDAEGNEIPEKTRPHKSADGASVDSELTLLSKNSYSYISALQNPLFGNSFSSASASGAFLVGRIDGPSPEICIRMINDAASIEKKGLLGMCYLDHAKKGGGYVLGDTWLDKIEGMNDELGIPNIIEQTKNVYVPNYPLNDAALYYGWYSHHFSGPFRNPGLKLLPGSIVTHIHSFSASKLRSNTAHWVGPILERGAAVTLGNVHEPFLHLTCHLDKFHEAILDGKTVVEAHWCSVPALSWHNVVLGDPLYRPFRNMSKSDSEYAVLRRLGHIKTKSKFDRLIERAEKAKSAFLNEVIGLRYTRLQAHQKALYYFRRAQDYYDEPEDKLRNVIHQIHYHQVHEQKDEALTVIKANLLTFKDKPGELSLLTLKNIINPPPPPPSSVDESEIKPK